jgi:hypothetical protein
MHMIAKGTVSPFKSKGNTYQDESKPMLLLKMMNYAKSEIMKLGLTG